MNELISIYMLLIHESHVFELRIETKFEVCDWINPQFKFRTFMYQRQAYRSTAISIYVVGSKRQACKTTAKGNMGS